MYIYIYVTHYWLICYVFMTSLPARIEYKYLQTRNHTLVCPISSAFTILDVNNICRRVYFWTLIHINFGGLSPPKKNRHFDRKYIHKWNKIKSLRKIPHVCSTEPPRLSRLYLRLALSFLVAKAKEKIWSVKKFTVPLRLKTLIYQEKRAYVKSRHNH